MFRGLDESSTSTHISRFVLEPWLKIFYLEGSWKLAVSEIPSISWFHMCWRKHSSAIPQAHLWHLSICTTLRRFFLSQSSRNEQHNIHTIFYNGKHGYLSKENGRILSFPTSPINVLGTTVHLLTSHTVFMFPLFFHHWTQVGVPRVLKAVSHHHQAQTRHRPA